MSEEPRYASDYTDRQTLAARRALVDVGQVLASFKDCMVIVGGWVPDLLIRNPAEAHVMSIDVDVALDSQKLTDGRYAQLLSLLLDTRRYRLGEESFKLYTEVDLEDGQSRIRVDIDFLASKEVRLRSRSPKQIEDFRVLQADGCSAAFRAPEAITVDGQMINGAMLQVELRVASLPDFLVMKCYALKGREKPKDAYDICYCLDQVGDGGKAIAAVWKSRRADKDIVASLEILRKQFASPEHIGPRQIVEFHQASTKEERAGQARRAYELVQRFLSFLAEGP